MTDNILCQRQYYTVAIIMYARLKHQPCEEGALVVGVAVPPLSVATDTVSGDVTEVTSEVTREVTGVTCCVTEVAGVSSLVVVRLGLAPAAALSNMTGVEGLLTEPDK